MSNVLIVVCFVLALFFPVAYSRSKWTMYPPGKALMFFSIIVTVVLGLGVWRVLAGEFAPDWLRHIAYTLVAVGLLTMDVVLLREQNKDQDHSRRERREGMDRLRGKL